MFFHSRVRLFSFLVLIVVFIPLSSARFHFQHMGNDVQFIDSPQVTAGNILQRRKLLNVDTEGEMIRNPYISFTLRLPELNCSDVGAVQEEDLIKRVVAFMNNVAMCQDCVKNQSMVCPEQLLSITASEVNLKLKEGYQVLLNTVVNGTACLSAQIEEDIEVVEYAANKGFEEPSSSPIFDVCIASQSIDDLGDLQPFDELSALDKGIDQMSLPDEQTTASEQLDSQLAISIPEIQVPVLEKAVIQNESTLAEPAPTPEPEAEEEKAAVSIMPNADVLLEMFSLMLGTVN